MDLNYFYLVFSFILLVSCVSEPSQEKLSIGVISKMPDDIEGCACYSALNDSLFNLGNFILASNNDSIAYLNINNKLIKVKRVKTTNTENTFKDHNFQEVYSNELYEINIDANFEKQTSFESWMFNGTISVTDTLNNSNSINFVGACGC